MEKYYKGHIIVVGLPKCGTSSLYFYLCQHPNILEPRKKETAYLRHDRAELSRDDYLNEYLLVNMNLARLKRKNLKNFYTLDVDGKYFYKKEWQSPRIAKKIVPNAKLLFIFRNPADRLYSNFVMNKKNPRFKEATVHKNNKCYRWGELEFKDHWKDYAALTMQIDISDYAGGLIKWKECFDKNRIYIMIYEEFFGDLKKSYYKLLEFLEIPKIMPKDLTPIIPYAQDASSTPGAHYSPLEKDLRQEIIEYYRPQIEAFEKMLGRKSIW
jgi:hypothetical protein